MKHQSFIILVLLTLFSSALISIIMPMAKEVAQALRLKSETQVQIKNSMFLIVGECSSIIWAILGDKFSRKIMLIFGTLIWSIFTFLTIFATDFYSLLFFQLIAAIGFGSALPLSFSILVGLAEVEKRGKFFGILSAAYVLGNGLGHILSGSLIDYYSWTLSFIIIATGGFICTISLLFMKEPIRGGMDISSSIADDSILGLSFKIKLKDFKKIWQKKTIFLILCFNFVMFIAIGAISSNFISILKNDYKFSSSTVTLILVVIFGSQMISGPVIGKIADKRMEKKKTGRMTIVLICLVGGATMYIIAFSFIIPTTRIFAFIMFFLVLFIGAFLFGGIDPLTQATLGDTSSPQIRSTVYSLNFLAYTFGRSISILICAYLFLSFNNYYRPGYLILAILALLCSFFLIIILRILPQDLDAMEITYLETN